MDPEKARLRARLGTDVPLVPFLTDSKGSVQPDFFRVLKQDGFQTVAVDPKAEGSSPRIIDHLNKGHFVLTLIKRRKNGNLHWVVMTRHQQGKVTVADSLRKQVYPEPF